MESILSLESVYEIIALLEKNISNGGNWDLNSEKEALESLKKLRDIREAQLNNNAGA